MSVPLGRIRQHCLSFDVEEHFQVSAFDSPTRRRHWNQFKSRVEQNTEKILEVLEINGTKGTFFVLGWVAKRHPALVKTIAERGHEVASHGYAHQVITRQTPTGFRDDVRAAKMILENIIGAPVNGYRAPSFTITSKTKWALPILVEEGYRYDSSIFPVVHDRYGMPDAHPWPHRIQTDSGPLWEMPPSTIQLGGMRIPIAGGGYFRLTPYWLLRACLRKVERGNHPLVMYLHPWELDPFQPRMRGKFISHVRHYVNLNRTQRRLEKLLMDFSFGPFQRQILEMEASPGETIGQKNDVIDDRIAHVEAGAFH
jgi:polysaccharide deacetylase family protein (PEP-CTERM system associated)